MPPRKKSAPRTPQEQWNAGRTLVGDLRRTAPLVTVPGSCPVDLCGAAADDQDESSPRFAGWTRAGVYGSSEPDRIWCSGSCAAYGIALAELRVRPAAGGSDA